MKKQDIFKEGPVLNFSEYDFDVIVMCGHEGVAFLLREDFMMIPNNS